MNNTQSQHVTYTNPRNSFIALGMSPEQADIYCAAPELLAALESLASDFRTTTRDCDKWNGYAAAVQAIAKAKGVSHE